MAQWGTAPCHADLVSKAISIEDLVQTLRALWVEIEAAPPEHRAMMERDITQTLKRLKVRIQDQLKQPGASRSRTGSLFEKDDESRTMRRKVEPVEPATRFSEPCLRVYDKDLAEHALRLLPHLGQIKTIDELRGYLSEKIRFNSLASRRRVANYLVNRFFPGEVFNTDLPSFAAATAGQSAFQDALFYLTCRTEKIVAMVAEEVVFPSLAQGGIGRNRILDYVQKQFPRSKSVKDICQAIVRTYDRLGVGTTTRTHLNVRLREGSLSAFAYILHLEFPEPGMFSFERLFEGPMHKWLLWDQQWMIQQLYQLREAGLLAKVSEIDRMRQFTTRLSLAEAVRPIVALAKGLRP